MGTSALTCHAAIACSQRTVPIRRGGNHETAGPPCGPAVLCYRITTFGHHCHYGRPGTISRVVMYRSSAPLPPGRSAENRSVRPSADRLGCASLASVLTGDPRLMGVDHGAPNAGRVATQMSCEPPALPGRSDDRNSSRPSKRIVGRRSLPSLLSSSTRTAGPNVPPCPSTLTKISRGPPGATRSLATYNSGSRRVIPPSNPALFTSDPRLTGVSHAKSSFGLARHETQMSLLPNPPARLLVK